MSALHGHNEFSNDNKKVSTHILQKMPVRIDIELRRPKEFEVSNWYKTILAKRCDWWQRNQFDPSKCWYNMRLPSSFKNKRHSKPFRRMLSFKAENE